MERVCSLITASHNGLLRKENHQSKEQIKICMFMTNPSFFLVLDPPPSCINSFWLKPFFALNVAWERLQATPATVPGNSHTMRALVKTGVFSEGIFRLFWMWMENYWAYRGGWYFKWKSIPSRVYTCWFQVWGMCSFWVMIFPKLWFEKRPIFMGFSHFFRYNLT